MIPNYPKFILDRDLFPLTKSLRMLGFDALCRGDVSLEEAIRSAVEDRRIWIRKQIEAPSLQYGIRYLIVQSEDEIDQLSEINSEYSIRDLIAPFSRCLKCNQTLVEVIKVDVKEKVPEKIFNSYQQFHSCSACERIYWPGSHLERMKEKLQGWGW